jgi:multidrug transporter EmrE-like cation transporter
MVFSSRAAHSRNIGIAYAVLYNVGFFSLLLSAYNLLHNRFVGTLPCITHTDCLS